MGFWATTDGLSCFAAFVSSLNDLLNGASAKTPHKKTLGSGKQRNRMPLKL